MKHLLNRVRYLALTAIAGLTVTILFPHRPIDHARIEQTMNRSRTLAGALLAITIFTGCASTEGDVDEDMPADNSIETNPSDTNPSDEDDD